MVGDTKVLNIRAKGQLMAKTWGRGEKRAGYSLGKYQELKHRAHTCAHGETSSSSL